MLEFARRFLRNRTEIRYEKGVGVIEINNRQLAATLVDLRTAKGKHLTSEQKQAAKAALCGIYVGFAVQYAKFNRDEERKNTGDGSDDDSKESEGMAEDGSDGSFVENAAKKQKGEPTSALTSGFTYPAADNDDDDDLEGFGFPEEVVEEEGRPDEKSEEELDEEAKEAAEIEFPTVFKNWVQLKIDWRTKFPEVDFPAAPPFLDVLRDLMGLDMGTLYNDIIIEDVTRKKYGFIPLLAGCSDAQIGALNAESFAERIISGANLVMGKGNTLLSDKYLEMLVVLRMNRKFMEHMRDHYGNELKMLSEFQAE